MENEKQLACSVIAKAISDFMISMNEKLSSKGMKRRITNMEGECYDFLTGKTEIARFWFQCADKQPLKGSMNEIYQKLKTT